MSLTTKHISFSLRIVEPLSRLIPLTICGHLPQLYTAMKQHQQRFSLQAEAVFHHQKRRCIRRSAPILALLLASMLAFVLGASAKSHGTPQLGSNASLRAAFRSDGSFEVSFPATGWVLPGKLFRAVGN